MLKCKTTFQSFFLCSFFVTYSCVSFSPKIYVLINSIVFPVSWAFCFIWYSFLSLGTVHVPLPRRTWLGLPSAAALTVRNVRYCSAEPLPCTVLRYTPPPHPVLRFIRLISKLLVWHITREKHQSRCLQSGECYHHWTVSTGNLVRETASFHAWWK